MDGTSKQIRAAWIRSGAYRRIPLTVYADQYMIGKAKQARYEARNNPTPYVKPLNSFDH